MYLKITVNITIWFLLLLILPNLICALKQQVLNLVNDYFMFKNVKYLCYLSCEDRSEDVKFVKQQQISSLIHIHSLVSQTKASHNNGKTESCLKHVHIDVGVLMDTSCENAENVLNEVSAHRLFDRVHPWLIIMRNKTAYSFMDVFGHLNISIDADIVAAFEHDYNDFELIDVFNFGKVQGNPLESQLFASWTPDKGLEVLSKGFKYYRRWDFHNLTLRGITVIKGAPKNFKIELLSSESYEPRVSPMTKNAAVIMNLLMKEHNFRINYTIADRWIGRTHRNATLAVSNSLYWRDQDIAVTGVRIFPEWLNWFQPIQPMFTYLGSKFYYLIPEHGVGEYENRFLTPMSPSVWYSAAGAGGLCGLLLGLAAAFERHPAPGYYAVFSVFAATCQQAYDEGVNIIERSFASQGRRLILLVLGLTSMLLYNYYTSAVVSWLLNAAPPSIASMDGLIKSDLELLFEDIGYTRQWLDGPGSYYFSGYKFTKEDELRDKKVLTNKRSTPLFQSVEDGIALMRTGKYAYHTEPYTASYVISRTFDDHELCALGALQMLPSSPVYMVTQKGSPYKEFFTWRFLSLLEYGHLTLVRRKFLGNVPPCSGRIPRALALGQAAPAFSVLLYAMLLCLLILLGEILHYSCKKWVQVTGKEDLVYVPIVKLNELKYVVACVSQ